MKNSKSKEALEEDKNNKETSDKEKYDAAKIQVLEGMEAVRKRPAMYIGDTFSRGLHHLVYEVVDNSVDEAMAGYASHITVILREDGGVRVSDNGRGIPVDEHPVEKKPALEVVLTKVKLMVTDRYSVVTRHVHQTHHRAPSAERALWRPLKEIP